MSLVRSYLVDSSDNSSHGGVPRPVDGPAIVRGSPRRAIDVDLVGLVAHRVGFYEIRHIRLVQHSYAWGKGNSL
jgi:hypothetical protein